jgi:hypothetical protein
MYKNPHLNDSTGEREPAALTPQEDTDPRAQAALAHALGIALEVHFAITLPLPDRNSTQILNECAEELRIGRLSGWRISQGQSRKERGC